MTQFNIKIPGDTVRSVARPATSGAIQDDGQCCSFSCVRVDLPDVVVDVLVYKGGASEDSYYFEGRLGANAQMVLYGGSPAAYKTVHSWPNTAGSIYEFAYDEQNEIFDKHFSVQHLFLVSPTVEDRKVYFCADLEWEKIASSAAQYLLHEAELSRSAMNLSARSLGRLAARADEIARGLLPALVHEHRATRRVLECLLRRIDGNLGLVDLPDPDKLTPPQRTKNQIDHDA